jgi:hypothetical protein
MRHGSLAMLCIPKALSLSLSLYWSAFVVDKRFVKHKNVDPGKVRYTRSEFRRTSDDTNYIVSSAAIEYNFTYRSA